MKISVATLFSQLYDPFVRSSLVARAQDKGLVEINVLDLFSFCAPKQRVDSPICGHGSGMLIKPELIEQVVQKLEGQHGSAYKIFFSPQGTKLDQFQLKRLVRIFQERAHIMLLPARYEGMDERVERHYADEVISIGDYVLMGGDLPAMVLLEGLLRYVPGVVGKQESVEQDSFSGPLVDFPHYTQPLEWQGMQVPEVVLSGNHAAMQTWRHEQALNTTVAKHFDWLRSFDLERPLADEVLKTMVPHYVVLMHDQVLLKNGTVGTSSVTSIDLHDIARSSATYGLKNFFVVTPLKDQQAIVQTFLDFWRTAGPAYNPDRYQALDSVRLHTNLDEVIALIATQEGKQPVLVATSAGTQEHVASITYDDQSTVWAHKRPVLFVLGTSHGLAPELINRCDYLLDPLKGLPTFNHLSVRSAAAVIFDRWLGLHIKKR